MCLKKSFQVKLENYWAKGFSLLAACLRHLFKTQILERGPGNPCFNPCFNSVAQAGWRTTSTFSPYGQVTQDYADFW